MSPKVRNLENLLDSGYPSTLCGLPVVIRNDDLAIEMERLKAGRPVGVLKVKSSPFKIYRPEALS